MDRSAGSTTEDAGSVPELAVEVRVHGIGDHDQWSSLGSPTLIVDGFPKAPDIAVPPEIPIHEVRLMNWSRTSRRISRGLWYLAIPFTLVNTAGYMCNPLSEGGANSGGNDLGGIHEGAVAIPRVSRFAVIATGLVLTLLTYVWSLAIVETLASRAFLAQTSSTLAGPVIAGAVGAVLVLGMLVRRVIRPVARIDWTLAILNILVVVIATSVALFRPSHWKVSDAVPDIFTTWGPSATFKRTLPGREQLTFEQRIANGELVPYLDTIVTVSIAATAVVALISLATLLRGFLRRARGSVSSPDFGSALALMSSVVLLISFASALRLFVDNGSAYLSNHDMLPGGEPGRSTPFRAIQLMSPLNALYANRDDWLVDLLPLVGIVGVVAMALGLLVSNLFQGGAGRPRLKWLKDSNEASARWKRGLVVRLPVTLGRGLALAGILWVILVLLAGALVLQGPERVWSWAVVIVQVVSVAVILLIVAGRRVPMVQGIVGMAADVVGFWPVASHPFAGASYLGPVVGGLRDELNAHDQARIVLVGHSQGSVVCAWLLRHSPDEFDRVALVTCGSPLKSLYAEFFPVFFGTGFSSALQAREGPWMNFWRDTDPIATPIPGLHAARNVMIPDPPAGQKLKVHSDYWIAAQQIVAIEELLAG